MLIRIVTRKEDCTLQVSWAKKKDIEISVEKIEEAEVFYVLDVRHLAVAIFKKSFSNEKAAIKEVEEMIEDVEKGELNLGDSFTQYNQKEDL